METTGLVPSRPVTFAEAEEIIDDDGHGESESNESKNNESKNNESESNESESNPDGMSRVYVSPALDGWTWIIGPWCDPCDARRSDDVMRLCQDLSVRHGQPQAYYYGLQGDGSAWLVAQYGIVLRRYCESGGEAEEAHLTLGEVVATQLSMRVYREREVAALAPLSGVLTVEQVEQVYGVARRRQAWSQV